jgi:hypothetical protein
VTRDRDEPGVDQDPDVTCGRRGADADLLRDLAKAPASISELKNSQSGNAARGEPDSGNKGNIHDLAFQ